MKTLSGRTLCDGGCGKNAMEFEFCYTKGKRYCWTCRNRLFRRIRHACGCFRYYERMRIGNYGVEIIPKSYFRDLSEKDCSRCTNLLRGGEANAKAAERNLPNLVGTPGQVAWAAQIREKYAANLGQERKMWLDNIELDFRDLAPSSKEKAFAIAEEFFSLKANVLQEIIEAKRWIEERHSLSPFGDPFYLVREELRADFRKERETLKETLK